MLDKPAREEVHRITDAGAGLSDDQSGRTRRYLWSMGIRTACFVGAVIAPSPWRWFLVAGAVFLPYVAVIMANAGRERSDREGFTVAVKPARRMLGRGSS